MLPIDFHFTNRRAVSGYEYRSDNRVHVIDPSLGFKTLNFEVDSSSYETESARMAFHIFQSFVELVEKVEFNFATSEYAEKVIDFYNNYGFVGGQSSDDEECLEFWIGAYITCFQEDSNERPTKIKIFRDKKSQGKSYIEPQSLWDFFIWLSNFPTKNSWTVCRYRILNGNKSRKRNLGEECPPLCILRTDGRRAWGPGCQAAWKIKIKREENK